LKLLYLPAFLISVLTVKGQTDNWRTGSVVLRNDQVLTGDILLHLDFNTVVLKSHDQLSVLNTQKVRSFRFYDPAVDVNRQFLTVRNKDEKESAFYELVVQGEFKLVRRLERHHDINPDDRNDFKYFIMDNQNLTPLRKFKKNILPMLITSVPQLKDWIDKEHLNLNEGKSAVLIIKEYNNLVRSANLLASN
jgi:hypothetical protein